MVSTVASHSSPVGPASSTDKRASAAQPGFKAALDISMRAVESDGAPGGPVAPSDTSKQKVNEPTRERAEKKRDGETPVSGMGDAAPQAMDPPANTALLLPLPPPALAVVPTGVTCATSSSIDLPLTPDAVSAPAQGSGAAPASAPALVQASGDSGAVPLSTVADAKNPISSGALRPAMAIVATLPAQPEIGAVKEPVNGMKSQVPASLETSQLLHAQQPVSPAASAPVQPIAAAPANVAPHLPIAPNPIPEHKVHAAESAPVPAAVISVPTSTGTHGLSRESSDSKAQSENPKSNAGEKAAGDQGNGAVPMPARFEVNPVVAPSPVPAHAAVASTGSSNSVVNTTVTAPPASLAGAARDPGSAGARIGATTLTASPAGVDQVVAPQAISTARVLQSMNGTEMRVGMHSQEFGSISIATAVSPGGVAAQIALDHGALSRALANHLPAIEDALGSALGVSARVEMRDNGMNFSNGSANGSGGNASAGAGSQSGSQGGAAGSYAVQRAGEAAYTTNASAEAVVNTGDNTRLSVQA